MVGPIVAWFGWMTKKNGSVSGARKSSINWLIDGSQHGMRMLDPVRDGPGRRLRRTAYVGTMAPAAHGHGEMSSLFQFAQLNQNSQGAKINVAIVEPNSTSQPWPIQRIPKARADGLLGHTDLIMRTGRLFFTPEERVSCSRLETMGAFKGLVKLGELCVIIQAFDLTNVFVPSSTSANTSTFSLQQPSIVRQGLEQAHGLFFST